MRKNGTAAAFLAFIALFAAEQQSYAQQAPPPGWQPPSNIDLYGGVIYKAMFFDDWRALPQPDTRYEFGYLVGAEGGLRLFVDPWYFGFGVEAWFLGEANVTGRQGALTVENEEDFAAYGLCIRLGNGTHNYNFALQLAGGYFLIDESISANGPVIAQDRDSDWYGRLGVTFERVLWGEEFGFRIWIALDLDYTRTGIIDQAGGKDMSFWGAGARIFFTY